MKHLAFLSLLTLTTPMWATTSAPSDLWHADFSSGSLPKNVSVSRVGQDIPVKAHYKHGFTEEGWTVEQFGYGFCAVCPTSTKADTPINSQLRTEFFTIPQEGATLTWTARSVLPGMEESYEVIISDYNVNHPGDVVLTVPAESAERFVTRSLSLDAYRGCTIAITFNCTSADKYMLAINEISVGRSDDYCVNAVTTTPRFAQNALPLGGTFTVSGTLLNTGTREIPAGTVIRAVAGGETIGSRTLSEAIPAAQTAEFSFPAEPADNTTTEYTVEMVAPDAAPETLFESDVTRSFFARTHFIDEGTGVWCNNCPQGNLDIDDLEQEYPGQIVPVCTHVNDVFANDAYWPNLKFYAVPYFMLDRNRNTAYSDTRKFADYLDAETKAGLVMKSCEIPANGQTADIAIDVTLAEDLDNADGRYGIGYVMTTDFYVPDGDNSFMQANMSMSASAKQYYYLPSVIPASLSFYRHVSLTHEYAFEPVPGSLPETIKAYETVTARITLSCPELVTMIDEATLVAFVLDKETGEIMNTVSYRIGDEIGESGVETLPADGFLSDAAPEYYTLQGIRVKTPVAGQMVIERRGSSVRKLIVR